MTTDVIRILLVEDSTADARLIEELLADVPTAQFTINRASNLKEALLRLADGGIDVVLLDLSLPDVQGLDTFIEARIQVPNVPLVVLSGLDDETLAMKAVQAGAQDYLVKGHVDGHLLVRSMRYAIERHHAEELRRKLFAADRQAAIGQLAAGVAHEISNPSAFIRVNLSAMREHMARLKRVFDSLRGYGSAAATIDPEAKREIEALCAENEVDFALSDMQDMLRDNLAGMDRIREITQALRAFGHLEPDRVVPVDMNELVREAAKIVQGELRPRAKLVLELNKVPRLPGDKDRLSQVVVNLLLNASQSISEGSPDTNTVTVRTSHEFDHVVLSVEDTGGGIPPENLERIFQPFFTTRARDKGTGLGLALCAEIARMHAGQIRVDSKQGRGSKFEVRLPVRNGLRPGLFELLADAQSRQRPKPRTRVLLVDDDGPTLAAYRRVLEPRHQVVTATGGAEALSAIERDPSFDAIVCDLVMSDADGASVYESIRTRWPELAKRVVFVTGATFTPRIKQFLSTVENHVLEKPISAEILLSMVDRLTDGLEAARPSVPPS